MAWALTAEEITTIEAYEKAAPSVVNITTQICEAEFFFCATPSATGSGSGVVLREDGLIITNSHVVSGAQNILVVLSDGRRLEASITASDPNDDLAVIKVDVGDKPLKAIMLGDSDKLKVGERVLAVGNPFGLGQTLTSGIVSMTGRTIKDDSESPQESDSDRCAHKSGQFRGCPDKSGWGTGGDLHCDSQSHRLEHSYRIRSTRKSRESRSPGTYAPLPRITGWVLAILLTVWFLRRIYRKQSRRYDIG